MSPLISEIPTHDLCVYTVVSLARVRTEVRTPHHSCTSRTIAEYHYTFLSDAQVRTIHAALTDLWRKRGYCATSARIAS